VFSRAGASPPHEKTLQKIEVFSYEVAAKLSKWYNVD